MNASVKHPYVLTAKDLLDRGVTSIPMLLKPTIQKYGVAALVGGSDTGKSYLMLDIALALCSSEKQILGYEISKTHGSVIYVSSEDDDNIMSYRLGRIAKNRVFDAEKIRFIFETDNLANKLKQELAAQPADMIVIDTLGDLFQANINQSVDVRKFLNVYKEIARTYKCLVLFIHHVSKAKESNLVPDKNDASGSEALQSACRVVINLKKLPDGKRQLTVVKGNNIEDNLKGKGQVLIFDPQKGFASTGEYVNFQSTAEKSNGIHGYDAKLHERVNMLYSNLKSYQKVADALKMEGIKIDKNKVGQYVKLSSSDPESGEEMIDG